MVNHTSDRAQYFFSLGMEFARLGRSRQCPKGYRVGKFWRDFYAGFDAYANPRKS